MITKSLAVKCGSILCKLRQSATMRSPAGRSAGRLAPRTSRDSAGRLPSTMNVKKKNLRPVWMSGKFTSPFPYLPLDATMFFIWSVKIEMKSAAMTNSMPLWGIGSVEPASAPSVVPANQ